MELQGYHSHGLRGLRDKTGMSLEKKANFKIGFEIEKTAFVNKYGEECENRRGEEIHDSELFWKFELDSSCGVEAVTHILPLDGVKSPHRKDVFKLFDEEKSLIDHSPTNTDCGGHINVSCEIEGYKRGINLAEAMRPKLALFYGMFAKRLRNNYCRQNTLILNGVNLKYSPVLIKKRLVEIRLPNAIRSVEQLKNRYDLTYKLLKYSTIEPITWKQFKNEVKPNLMRIYNRDEEKVNDVLLLSDMFRKYLITKDMTAQISRYFSTDERERWNELFNIN